ncbi:DNA gyrase subunit A [Candidatus Wolfebacteria bacterium RIFCSPLOWO2_01_FULL_45_19]|uniref:DNA gyrase subunit A n=1 Tax=Candidatus Wolfebacteria bacterium RIFCSPLOWO2_01_FULL_45_19 TaxID=1802557 RepID=A0A1F8DQ69_9BACT|nr:MAG: gyrase subunit A protein [Parcubacteria group bacterium GW2011_GWB1_45_9]OGM90760.1 MAG: DNA gyrase subunit A [Candidatus Wolfebacteria bacterium RIFCSPLOWO2_01_FULL_45_19]
MSNNSEKIQNKEIIEELKESYLDYAMSVIVSRALPDVRDGLKPVHRRILWSMWEAGLTHSSKFLKSANVIGVVLAKYHPHGDSAVYEAMVRMAQDFSLRAPLVDGQGNFGSIDGDSAAAYRYTEARLSKISEELLLDIEKETVDWQSNYDGTKQEPKVLPAKLPNLLLNGAMGIAVGMTTNIPPHNLNEIIDAILCLIEDPKATSEDLAQIVLGPDFPTGGIIYNKKEIAQTYASGRGAITTRGVAEIQERKGGFNIVITEIPYHVNKSELIIKMAELVQDKRIDGIRDIRDESDREGLRIFIELKNDAVPQKILNQLYQHTDLQKDFHMNMLALADGVQPQIMSLKDVLIAYIEHRKIVVRRRAEFDLKKAEERAHILTGLSKALSVIDKVIAVIKKSDDREDAKKNLIKSFKLTEIQTNAILEMRLQTLAALERQKIDDELKEKERLINELQILLKNSQKISKVIKDELAELKNKFGEPRRTKLIAGGLKEFREEDLVPEEEVVITFSQSGYIKRLPPGTFRAQRRGGKGLIGSEVGEEDLITHFIQARTHDNILFFTDRGRVFQTKVYEIPQATRTAKGKAVQNFLEIPTQESVSAIVSYKATSDKKQETNDYLVMLTQNGVIKKISLDEFDNVRRSGIIAIKLHKGDALRWVKLSSGGNHIIITTAQGQGVRFKESDARPMGRNASGVRAIRLRKDDRASSLDIINKDAQKAHLLVVTANGFGKRTLLSQFRIQRRGGSGTKAAKITAKTGQIVSAHVIDGQEMLLAISAKGQIIKTNLSSVRIAGRATQGVKIMNVRSGDKIAGVVCL